MAFNENSRVKIPALLHLKKLGYSYIKQKDQKVKEEVNIFPDIFINSICRINQIEKEEAERLLEEICLELDFEDLGKKFYQQLTASSGKTTSNKTKSSLLYAIGSYSC